MSNPAFTRLSKYLSRSANYVKGELASAIRMDVGWQKELPMFQFDSVEWLENFVVGSDADIGGLSEAYWGLTEQNTGLFWGVLSTTVPEGVKLERSGYAGIRSKERPITLFHRPRFDTRLFRYLAIRAKGDHHQWLVNLQCDTIYDSFLWQHRLNFKTPGEWETIMIPFQDFILTSNGYVQKRQLALEREKVKTVGFSIVRQAGDFSLELDWIKAMNTPATLGDLDLVSPAELARRRVAEKSPQQQLLDAWNLGVKDGGGGKARSRSSP
ncbi:complex I intermediate-associated protein 30-domain-containing protein [Zopfochytrium polystomum]|nr:complex I intermediate-associated protein 30-domain-containing protein [Zopfochytrium polystomum]